MVKLNVPAMRIRRRLMKAVCAFRRIIPAMRVDSCAGMANVFHVCGLVMVMTIAVITAMKTRIIVPSIRARPMSSAVIMAGVYLNRGNVM